MLGPVVDHVAALAERCHLVERAVAGIVIEVRTGQHHRCPQPLNKYVLCGTSHTPPLPAAPAKPLAVPPPPISQMEDPLTMGATAMLASASCPNETDMMRQLRPVDRIQEHMFGTDRHQTSDPVAGDRDAPAVSEAAVAAVSAR